MKTLEQVNQSIAFIETKDSNGNPVYFQVLNAEESDWDEEATKLIYEEWKANQI